MKLFGCKTGKYIGLGEISQRHKCVHPTDVLFSQHIIVAGVAMNYSDVAVSAFMRQTPTDFYVIVDYSHVIICGSHMNQPNGNAASPHNHHFLYLIITLAAYRSDFADILMGCCEIKNIILHDFIVTTGYDCLMTAFYRRNMIVMLVECYITQLLTYKRCIAAQFHPHHNQLPMMEF